MGAGCVSRSALVDPSGLESRKCQIWGVTVIYMNEWKVLSTNQDEVDDTVVGGGVTMRYLSGITLECSPTSSGSSLSFA